MASLDRDVLLKLIARINPYVWEVVGGGPLGLTRRLDAVALNPQPLPPKDLGTAALHVLAARAFLTRDFSRFMDDVEELCPRERTIPKPKGPFDEPVPQPNWESWLGAAVAAVELAHGGGRAATGVRRELPLRAGPALRGLSARRHTCEQSLLHAPGGTGPSLWAAGRCSTALAGVSSITDSVAVAVPSTMSVYPFASLGGKTRVARGLLARCAAVPREGSVRSMPSAHLGSTVTALTAPVGDAVSR